MLCKTINTCVFKISDFESRRCGFGQKDGSSELYFFKYDRNLSPEAGTGGSHLPPGQHQ